MIFFFFRSPRPESSRRTAQRGRRARRDPRRRPRRPRSPKHQKRRNPSKLICFLKKILNCVFYVNTQKCVTLFCVNCVRRIICVLDANCVWRASCVLRKWLKFGWKFPEFILVLFSLPHSFTLLRKKYVKKADRKEEDDSVFLESTAAGDGGVVAAADGLPEQGGKKAVKRWEAEVSIPLRFMCMED